jgi:hypothetical protein
VDPTSNNFYPDNLIHREYYEELLTIELLFSKIPFGDRLRLGFRVREQEPSLIDSVLFRLKPEFLWDDKIYAQLNWEKREFWVGDVYETFGKGLALNLFENRDLYFDSGLRGGKFTYLGDKFRFKAVYGQSRTGYLVEKENVAGINAEYRPIKKISLGSALVFQEGLYYKRHYTPEVYAGWDWNFLSFYGEYAQNRSEDLVTKSGAGTYLSLTTAISGIALQGQYKYYRFGAENPFQTPPTVQREFTSKLLSAHPHLPLIDDQVGFELDFSASPSELFFVEVDFSRASKHKGAKLLPSLNQDYNPFWELFCEGEYYIRPDLTLKMGFGWNEEARTNFWQEKVSGNTEIVYNLNDYWSLSFSGENMWVEDKEAQGNYQDHYLALTLGRAPFANFTFSYEGTSLESSALNDQWLGAELALTIKEHSRLQIFYGQERGGIKCTSGVCRPVQPFEGVRIILNSRF